MGDHESVRTLWLGATGFERRSLGSLLELAREGVLDEATVINYETKLDSRGKRALREHRAEAELVLSRASVERRHRFCFPYRMSSIRAVLSEALDSAKASDRFPRRWIIDISAMTKVQTVAVGEWIYENSSLLIGGVDVVVAYTSPSQYGFQTASSPDGDKYPEDVTVPLGVAFPRDYSSPSVSIVALVGHEGARLRLALAGHSVSRGVYVLTDDGGGDAIHLARIENAAVIRDLNLGIYGRWHEYLVEEMDFPRQLRRLADEVAGFPRSSKVVFVPLGPKPLVLATTIQLLRNEVDPWLCCPISGEYRGNRMAGIGKTRYWRVDHINGELNQISLEQVR